MPLDPTKAERQARWRGQSARGAAIAIHLSPDELRALDWIAVQLFEADPHDPAEGQIGSRSCGRTAAVRHLIAEYAATTKIPATLPPPDELGAFWRSEAIWRRRTKDVWRRVVDGPLPPWSSALRARARKSLSLNR